MTIKEMKAEAYRILVLAALKEVLDKEDGLRAWIPCDDHVRVTIEFNGKYDSAVIRASQYEFMVAFMAGETVEFYRTYPFYENKLIDDLRQFFDSGKVE